MACISLGDIRFCANTERFQGSVTLLPHLCPLSVPKGGGGYVGYIRKALEKGFWRCMGLGGGGPEPYFSENWPLPLTVWGFFCLFWSSFRHTAPHPYPHYSNVWAYQGQVIWVDLLHSMCRRHVQPSTPQYVGDFDR